MNLDVIACIEIDEGYHEALTVEDARYAGLDEKDVWNIAYRNTENRVFLELPEEAYTLPETLKFVAHHDCEATGILFKNLLWNFCNEQGIDYCFVIPDVIMRVAAPVRLKSQKLMEPKKQAEKLLKVLAENIDCYLSLSPSDDNLLDPVIYIYDKLFNHIQIFVK